MDRCPQIPRSIRSFLSNETTASVFKTSFFQLNRMDSQWMKFGSDHKPYRILDTSIRC